MKRTFTFLFCISILAAEAQPGSLDPSFGIGGKVITNLGYNTNDRGTAVAIQADGKIVLAGTSNNNICCPLNDDFVLARYNSDGTLDNTFCSGGLDTANFGSIMNESYHDIYIQNDGKILAGGSSYNGSDADFALVRYNSDGTFDSTFGSAGKVFIDFGGTHDLGRSVVMQPDGKILMAGLSNNGSDYDFALVRYNSNGSLDTTFGSAGKTLTDFGGYSDAAYSMFTQTDGKIVVAGSTNIGSDYNYALARYFNNGSLDTAFGTSGKVITAIGSSYDNMYSAAIQSNGKIVLAGDSFNGVNYDFALVRYNTNGNLDTAFGIDGKIIMDVSNSADGFSSVSIQNDDKIVVAGGSVIAGNGDFALMRYNDNGSLDSAFGSSGLVLTDFGTYYDHAYTMSIQADGKIILAGTSYDESDFDFALARYEGGTVGVEEDQETSSIHIFPNPSSGIFTIDIKRSVEANICIYDVLGNCVLNELSVKDGHQLDLSTQPKGIYFLEMLAEGEKSTKKIVLR